MPVRQKIRVLIVDDSPSVRRTLGEIIASDPALEVLAQAADPFEAAAAIRTCVPDVIFLDLEMPRMDGLTFLRKVMAQRPIPVVICSSHSEEGSEPAIQALESGAVDVIAKPRVHTARSLQEARNRICDIAKAAAHARVGQARVVPRPLQAEPKLTADAIIPPSSAKTALRSPTAPIVCIGASTGGTEALRLVLQALPANSPGLVIVQHMPERFTAAFAKRLDSLCTIQVKEAAQGDVVRPGCALIAPGDHHLLLNRVGAGYEVAVQDGPPVRRHRPSVDVLFRSAAQSAGANAMGVLMTGMGDDGAHGLLEMRQAAAHTLVQDEESCIVFGMPREAIALGAAAEVRPLGRIAAEIMGFGAQHMTPQARRA